MPWTIVFEEKTGILYSEMHGLFTADELYQHAAETVEAVIREGSHGALVDLRPMEGGVSLSDIYDLPMTYEKENLPRHVKIAIIAVYGAVREDDLMFFTDRCRNMGYMVEIFTDEASARKWLCGESD